MTTPAAHTPGPTGDVLGRSRPPVPHRGLTAVLTLVVPALLSLAVMLVAATWTADLPELVAVHFAPQGADGFATVGVLVAWTVGAIGVTALLTWAAGTFVGQQAVVRRAAAGLSVGLAAFLASLTLGLLAAQRGLADASQVGDIDSIITAAMLAAVTVGALAAWAVPGDVRKVVSAPPPDDAPRLPLAARERAVWMRAEGSKAGVAIAVGLAALFVVLTTATRELSLVVPAVAVPTLILALTQVVVVVDARGLTVRSRLGRPRFVVPLDEVVRADAGQVHPLREYGGWGYRAGRDGRVGIVVRAGDALEVERTGGRVFVVTVDDAATGAALLNTLAERSRLA